MDLGLLVWGVETKSERFQPEARACDISLSGALLSGIDADVRSGDVIGILYARRKARYRVIWVRYDECGETMQVAVPRVDPDICPSQHLLAQAEAAATAPAPLSTPAP